ncbi:MAG: hypothetical protein IT384_00860 [Deltaproteobacteria bacterium]|nr:hypothetical protein [Deltaproteobacteria bacterium]
MSRALLLVTLLGASCLPNPQSLPEARESFDRRALLGSVIVSTVPPLQEVGAVFDERLELVGYDLDPASPRRGDSVEIRFYWRARRSVSEDYRVFIHADAQASGARRIHGDHFPAGGRYPTWAWREGELIADAFRIAIPRDYGPDRLEIYAGLYRGEYRVPLTAPGLAPADRENRSRAITISLPSSVGASVP